MSSNSVQEQPTVTPLFAFKEKDNRGVEESDVETKQESAEGTSESATDVPQEVNIDQVLKELDGLKKEREKLQKQVFDSRKWGNDQNMKLKTLIKSGDIDEETAAKLSLHETSLAENPFEAVNKRWSDDLERLKPIMDARGENVEDYYDAFNEWLRQLPPKQVDDIADEILSLPANEWTSFMLEKGRDFHSSFYSEIKQSGSFVEAYKAVKEKAEKLASDYDKLKAKYDTLKSEMKEDLHSGYGKHALSKGGSSSDINDEPASHTSIADSFLHRRNLKLAR